MSYILVTEEHELIWKIMIIEMSFKRKEFSVVASPCFLINILYIVFFLQDRKMSWAAGDWMCPACQNQNFKKRDACQNCNYPRYGGPEPSTWTVLRLGDWYCTAVNCENQITCGAHNFASRSNCYVCGSRKQAGGPTKPGDWTCPR